MAHLDWNAMSELVDQRVAHATLMSAGSRLVPGDRARLEGIRTACDEARRADAPALTTVRQALASVLLNDFSKVLERCALFERAHEQMLAAEEMEKALRTAREQAELIDQQGQEIAALKGAALLHTGDATTVQRLSEEIAALKGAALLHTGDAATVQRLSEEIAALKGAALLHTGDAATVLRLSEEIAALKGAAERHATQAAAWQRQGEESTALKAAAKLHTEQAAAAQLQITGNAASLKRVREENDELHARDKESRQKLDENSTLMSEYQKLLGMVQEWSARRAEFDSVPRVSE